MSGGVAMVSFVISPDVVHPEFDQQTLLDYVKSNFRGSFVPISMTRAGELGVRQSRADRPGGRATAVEALARAV